MARFTRLAIAALLVCAYGAGAQVSPILQPHQTFYDASGQPCSRCSLYTYAAGSTTPLATYKDSSGTIQHTNPVILDVSGSASLWVGVSAYKFVLKNKYGQTVWTADNVTAPTPASGSFLPLTGGTLVGTLTDASGFIGPVTGNVTGNVTGTAGGIVGTLPHSQLPTLLSADIPDNAANTTGTAANLSGNPDVSVNSVQINGATVIPATVTGYLGSSGTALMLASGSFTIGHCLQVGTDGGLADAGAACGTGGGGGGLAYSSPTLNAIPAVSNVAGFGTVINSAFSDDGFNTYDSEPFILSADYTIQPTGTATSGTNYVSHSNTACASLWNGSAAVPECLQHYVWIGSGTNPAVLDDHYFPAGLSTNTTLYAINASTLATNSVNYNTVKFKLRGAYWTGSASANEDWDFQGVVGTGANPTDWLTFTHTGSSGAAGLSAPQYKATGGTAGVQWTAAAFSTFPACASGTEGLQEAVTDSTTATWGATVTGGGTNHIQMRCNGTAWTVVGK